MTARRILSAFSQLKSATKNHGDLLLTTATTLEVRRIKHNDDLRTLETLYEIYHRPIYRLCFRMTQNSRAAAESLTQRVFVRLFKKLKNYAQNSDWNAQILQLAIDELLCYFLRNDERFNNPSDSNFRNFGKRIGNKTTKLEFDRRAIEKAIARLPADYRLIFLLHDFERLPHAEIARILKIEIATSRFNLHEARVNLRRQLIG